MFSKLPDYLEWANGRSLASIESLDAPGDTLRSLLGHLLAAEDTWFARIGGREPELDSWPSLGLAEMRSVIARNAEACRDILRSSGGLSGVGMAEWMVDGRNAEGEPIRYRASDVLMHVFVHGGYHRGQIASAVKRLGGQPAVTDYIMFCRETA